MKLKQMILCLLLAFCITAICLPTAVSAENTARQGKWTGYAATSFDGGSGTKEDPYRIATAEQLALLAKDVNSGAVSKSHTKEYFILTADIDLSGHVWTPLGYESYASGGGSAQSFNGYFDGNGKKITGLYVDERAGDEYGKNRNAGLFGCVSAVSTEPVIQNLIIEDGIVLAGDGGIDEDYGAGLLVGKITVLGNNVEFAAIKNCTVSGEVNSTRYAGGLVGNTSYTHFENCRSEAKVTGYCVSGGFVGNTFESEFTDCVAVGNVKSSGWSTGGFAGILFCNTTVKHCAAFGNVEADNWNIGGFVGYAEENTVIENSIAMGNVKSNVEGFDPKAGGFSGTACSSSKFVKCHAEGKVTVADEGSIGGMIAIGEDSSAENCSFDKEKNASLNAVGDKISGEYGAAAQKTAEVLSNICNDYYEGHDMAAKPEQKPTCTEDGHKAGSECTRCGHREGFETVAAAGHKGGTATCSKRAVCEVCQNEYGELNIANHIGLKHVAEKAATKDAEGNIGYWYCEDCDRYFSDAEATVEITKADTVKAKLNDNPGDGHPIPITGDDVKVALWIALLFVSGGAAVGAKICWEKRRKSE